MLRLCFDSCDEFSSAAYRLLLTRLNVVYAAKLVYDCTENPLSSGTYSLKCTMVKTPDFCPDFRTAIILGWDFTDVSVDVLDELLPILSQRYGYGIKKLQTQNSRTKWRERRGVRHRAAALGSNFHRNLELDGR